MENNSDNLQFLVCSACGGSGLVDRKKCKTCQGKGMTAYLDGYILFWGEKINTRFLRLYKLERFITKAVYIILFILGLFGIFCLGYAFYLDNFINILNLSFWQIKNPLLLIFWLSIFVDMYLVYYFALSAAAKEKVIVKKYKSINEKGIIAPPELDWQTIKKLGRKVDISKAFSEEAILIIEHAFDIAKKYSATEVGPVHFLIAALISSKNVQNMFMRLSIDFEDFALKISRVAAKYPQSDSEPFFNQNSIKILLKAYRNAYINRSEQVLSSDIVVESVKSDKLIQEVLTDLNITPEKVENVVLWYRIREILHKQWLIYRGSARLKSKTGIDRAMTALQTSFLNQFSEDLTLLAKSGYLPLCIGREKEFAEIFRILEGSSVKSVVLVGDAGVGKTAMVEGLAQKMIADDVPEFLQDKRLVSLSISQLLAGASISIAQERFYRCLNEIIMAGNVILFIDNLHDMIPELIEILTEALSKNAFIFIGSTNTEGYKNVIERSSVGSILKKIQINEPDINSAVQILEGKAGFIEAKNNIYFSYDALEQAVKLTDRYMHDQNLPYKALTLLEEVGVWAKNNLGANVMVSGNDVATLISEKLGVKAAEVTQSESEKLLKLEEIIHNRIIDQDEAVKAVANSLRRARAELRETKRPIANLLFLGPTGVGKTELAKVIAEVYFGSEENMIRLDMSEYQEKSSISRLIGAPPGYEGSSEGGQLTEAVRQKPFSIVLLDELEKAHPDILNLFLQVMDDGRLTDSTGRTIDFTNVILIATSNAQTSFIQEKVNAGVSLEEIKRQLLETELKQYFKLEFINRFDNIIIFKPLGLEEVIKISRLLLQQVAKNLEAKGINFQANEEAIVELANEGYDPQFGARPLRRAIQDKVDNALAQYLLTGKIGKRDLVILDKGGVIRVEKAKEL
ncbi:AAA family ATPase [Candidatus Falkowbacteria bacterium]|nr:AAA family ATPase [Candidatus Falkowbacteria bacterium]